MRSRQPSHHHGSGAGRSDRGGSRSRRLRPGVERLEKREVMSAIPAPPVYQNPYMAPNNFSEIHLNSSQTDTFSVPGPASFAHQKVQQRKISPIGGIAGSLAVDSTGQLVTIRVGPTVISRGADGRPDSAAARSEDAPGPRVEAAASTPESGGSGTTSPEAATSI